MPEQRVALTREPRSAPAGLDCRLRQRQRYRHIIGTHQDLGLDLGNTHTICCHAIQLRPPLKRGAVIGLGGTTNSAAALRDFLVCGQDQRQCDGNEIVLLLLHRKTDMRIRNAAGEFTADNDRHRRSLWHSRRARGTLRNLRLRLWCWWHNTGTHCRLFGNRQRLQRGKLCADIRAVRATQLRNIRRRIYDFGLGDGFDRACGRRLDKRLFNSLYRGFFSRWRGRAGRGHRHRIGICRRLIRHGWRRRGGQSVILILRGHQQGFALRKRCQHLDHDLFIAAKPLRWLQLKQAGTNNPDNHEDHRGAEKMVVVERYSRRLGHGSPTR